MKQKNIRGHILLQLYPFNMKYFLFFALSISSLLYGAPSKGKLIHGSGRWQQNGDLFEIHQNSDKMVINWDNFSIAKNEIVRFIQSSKTDGVLNRVTGNMRSDILGSLQANGKVYLINPHGIWIGPESKIQACGFIASALDLSNEDFISGKNEHFFHVKDSDGKVENFGEISSIDGDVILLGKSVADFGKISVEDGSIGLFSTKGLVIQPSEEESIFIYVNKESISSEDIERAGGSVYSLAVNCGGILSSTKIAKKGGQIFLYAEEGQIVFDGKMIAKNENSGGQVRLLGSKVHVKEGAQIDVSGISQGGEVLIGGDFKGKNPQIMNAKKTIVDKNTNIFTDALETGNGGKVIIWSEEFTAFSGNISAKGGALSGNGGFVEISSPKHLFYQNGKVTTEAPHGIYGTLYLDPADITIADFGGTSTPAFPTTPPATYAPAVATASLDVANVTTALATNNVFVSTAAGVGGAGRILVTSNISWSAATTLTLQADQDVFLSNVTITNSHTGSGNFTAMDFRGNTAGTTTGNFHGVQVAVTTLNSTEGNIILEGRGGTALANQGILLLTSQINSLGTGANAAMVELTGTSGTGNTSNGILLGGPSTISTVDGDVELTGTSIGASTLSTGITLDNASTITSTGTSSGGSITLNGNGSANGTSTAHGIRLNGLGTSSSVNGAIILSGTGGGNGTNTTNDGITFAGGYQFNSTGTGANAAPITMTGIGGIGTGTNRGISIIGAAGVGGTSSVDGDITVTGTGGANVNSIGILVSTAGKIRSTGTGSNAANISITGTGGTPGNNCSGVVVQNVGSIISAIDGDIAITGTGGSGAGAIGNNGVAFQAGGVLSVTGSGSVDIDGTGTGLTGAGLLINNAQVTKSTGTLDITAVGPGTGISMVNAASQIGGGSGDVTLTTETITLTSGQILGTGVLTIQTLNPATSMALGTGAVGTLSLNNTELSTIQPGFNTVIFGRSNATNTVQMQAFTFSNPMVVRGANINVLGAIANGANNITFNIGTSGTGTGSTSINALVTTSGTFQVNGGAPSNTFTIGVTGLTANLQGGGATNTLNGPNALNSWLITGNGQGILNSTIFFNFMQILVGGTLDDTFTFNGPFQISGSPGIDGNLGTNTLIVPFNIDTELIFTGPNSGFIFPQGAPGLTEFINIQNLIGNFVSTIDGISLDFLQTLNQMKYYFILWRSYEKSYEWFDSVYRFPFDTSQLASWRISPF
ncbi:MAG: filamentous hemagglutinin N-terminal domain-containing protein [Chlamydiae bacterium]|nr:filamentous hemagglutinin N-terminal domain-containing protein [Chlamydiota bacterium]